MRIVLTLILVLFAAFCCLAFLLCGALPKEGLNGRTGCRLIYGTAVVACVVALKAVWREDQGALSARKSGVRSSFSGKSGVRSSFVTVQSPAWPSNCGAGRPD